MIKYTVDDITQEILDTCDFLETNSLSKAKRLVTAVNRYMVLVPNNVTGNNKTVVLNITQIEKFKNDAELFIANYNGGSVKYLGVANYRGQANGGYNR